MPTWLVKLEGETIDLEEFPEHFAAGPMHGVKEGDSFFICGEALEHLQSAREVRDTAQAFIDEASGVISLLWPAFRKPDVGAVYRDHGGGRRDIAIFVEGAEVRAKAGRIGVVVGGETVPPVPVAARMLDTAQSNQHLRRALLLWSDRPRSWHRLSAVIEELQHFAASIDKEGYCSGAELRRFRHTANTAEAAGLDARHASNPKRRPPRKPMTLGEAESFVRTTLSAVLRRAAGL